MAELSREQIERFRTVLLDAIKINIPEVREREKRMVNALCDMALREGYVQVPVVDDVMAEIGRAISKFPTWPTDPLHAAGVVAEEAGELHKAVLQHTYEPHKASRDDVREEAIQTAAMALRFLSSMDVYLFKPCLQHKQEWLAASEREAG
jgi:NTP pyrophosphatase (non-canonical NTP hydrolase)